MKDLKRQLVSERRRAEKLQDRLQEVLSDSRNTCTKSRSRGFQCQTIVIWCYDHFVPKDISYPNGHNDSFVICTIKNLYLHHYYRQGIWLNFRLNIFVHIDPKICFIVMFVSLLGVEDLLAGNDGNESLDRRSVYYCNTVVLCTVLIFIFIWHDLKLNLWFGEWFYCNFLN